MSRDRNRQKFDILEETVSSMSKRMEELEEKKEKLQAQINVLQSQQNLRKQSEHILLPQIEKVIFQSILCNQTCAITPAIIFIGHLERILNLMKSPPKQTSQTHLHHAALEFAQSLRKAKPGSKMRNALFVYAPRNMAAAAGRARLCAGSLMGRVQPSRSRWPGFEGCV